MKTNNNKLQQILRQRQWLTRRNLVAGISFLLIAGGMFIYFNFSQPKTAVAGPSAGDYRSKTSGNWNNTSTWEMYNGLSWASAVSTPSSSSGAITIQTGHTVSIVANANADQLTVDGQINVTTGTFTIQNTTGADLTVNGTVTVTSTLAMSSNSTASVAGTLNLKSTGTINLGSSASFTIANNGRMKREGGTMPTAAGGLLVSTGGTYEHAMNGGTIPSANWSTGATCEITGVTTNLPAGLTQTFKNFTWNCPNQSATLDNSTALKNISETLTISSTGSGVMFFDQQGNNLTMNIGGNFNVNGGTIFMCENGSDIMNVTGNINVTGGLFSFCRAGATAYGNTSGTINLTGNLNVTGGTIDMSQYTANNAGKGYGVINIKGNILVSGSGLITETQNSRGQIYFCGTTAQTYNCYNKTTNFIDYIVNSGAILRCDNQLLNSDGTFTLLSGGGIMIGSADGITQTALAGNIQCTGTRSYSTGADYTYNGLVAQYSGDGLPSMTHNLTLGNNLNLTMSGSSGASNLLTLTIGKIITGSYEINVTNTSESSVVGYSFNNYIVGNLRRSVLGTGSYPYPLGTLSYYEFANVNLSLTTGFSNILGFFTNANPINPARPLNATLNGSPLTSMLNYGYWTFTPNANMSGGTYTMTVSETGYTNIIDYATDLCVVKRADENSSWQSIGVHDNATQSVVQGVATAVRSAYTGFSNFGIAKKGSAAYLPIELMYFNATLNGKKVDLDWATSSEVNNNYFTVERSSDGEHFEPILQKKGAGNSTTKKYYRDGDDAPLQGISYYKLKQTDFDGHSTYSRIRSVKSGMDKADVMIDIRSIYPNPFHEAFNIIYNNPNQLPLDIMLMSCSGELIRESSIAAQEGLSSYKFNDIQDIKSGIYYVILKSGKEKYVQRIVKA